MKSVRTKRWASLLAALLLCTLLCAVPVFADEADGGESSTSSTDAAQDDTLAADSFFDQLEAGNGIGTTLFVSGFVLAGVGVVGIIGLIIGLIGGTLFAVIGGFPPVFTPTSILFTILFSAGVGIVFGVYPAKKAAQMSPIEALRHD